MAKEKRALGTGLEALFGTDFRALQEESVTSLPITRVEPRPDQPRDSFDEERLQDLADSISRHGLIQPVIVRKLENGNYQIIAGERRWRAARLAGLPEIPVRVLQADDRSVSELALVENLQREDLNPMEEARGYQKLMTDYALTQEEAAAGVGKSRSAVANALRLLNLSTGVASLVERGELSAGHARALLPIEDPELQQKAAALVMSKALSVRKTEQLAARLKKEAETEATPAPAGDLVDYAAVLSEELSLLLGRKAVLSEKKGRGKIELFFDNADDREQLIQFLKTGNRK
jgi:ParB family chromosome partitioning protein